MADQFGQLGQWAQVLDDTDHETARLILQLQLEDLESVEDDIGTQTIEALQADQAFAHNLFKQKLEEYQKLRKIEFKPAEEAIEEPVEELDPPPSITFPCIICGDRNGADHCYQVPCQHYYCDDCLNQLFRTAMNDEQFYPPRCCSQPVPFEDVRLFLDSQLATQFAAAKSELDDTKRTYCHVLACSAYIYQDNKLGSIGTCPRCKVETCLLCKQAGHKGDCAKDEAMEETRELARTEGWQTCPSCARLVELNTGCNHMTCRCNAQFCYVCGATWKNCTCPQFDENRLLARAEVVQAREGGNLQQLVNHFRNYRECDRHNWVRRQGGADCETCGDTLTNYIFRCSRCRELICRRCRFNS